MPQLTRRYQGGSTDEINPLVGWQYEYLPWDAEIEIAIFGYNTGDTGGALGATYSAFSGSDLLAQDNQVLTKPIANSSPQYPYDYNLQDIAAAGERIGISIKPSTFVAANFIVVAVRVTPA